VTELTEVTVLRGGALGDFILTLPAIAAVAQAYPRCTLHVVAHTPFARFAAPHRITDHDNPDLGPLFNPDCGEIPRATRCLFESSQVVLAYVAEEDGSSLQRLRSVVPGHFICGDPRPDPMFRTHITEHLLSPVRSAGIAVSDPLPLVPAAAIDKESDLAGQGSYIAIHPGSGGLRKCWSVARFVELGHQLSTAGLRPVFVCGPVERERPGFLGALAGMEVVTVDLHALPDLLRRADLLIGNDSGPGHLAAAVGTRTLSLFGSTDPMVWRPLGADCKVVQAPDGELERLGVETVFGVALGMLEDG
jgi:heptosyltransferase-3